VLQWSGPMIDADGDGVVGGPGDFARVAAVRLAVVARSKNPEKINPKTGVCAATKVLPTVFNSASPATTAAVPMQVNVAVAGDAIDWKCYHYRVFETIVTMRNLEWRP
jgi:type IV pilus assembly protein PilW